MRPPLPVIGIKGTSPEDKIKVYPTIVQNELHIDIDDLPPSLCQMTLSDIYGSTCGEITLNSIINSVDLGDLSNGIYFLILEIEHKRVQKKIVVIR